MNKVYGYCRVSTPKQSITRQERNILAAYPDAILLRDEYTGTSMHRPAWDKLMKVIRDGDTIVFDSVSRMSRDAAEGFEVYEALFSRGIDLIFLKEMHINTSTYKQALQTAVPMTGTSVDYILEGINKYLLELAREQIRLACIQSEKEVADLRQRTVEGLISAKARGSQVGQAKGAKLTTKKSISAKEIIRTHCKDFGGSLGDQECIVLAKCCRNTYYKYKSQIRAELLQQ